jgi:hemerythrin
MKPIVWTEKISVGINSFDDEHKHLINFINKLNNALEIRSTQKTMEEILAGLVDYTQIHFKHEEDAMLKYDYPDYTKHKKEHDNLTSQVSEFHKRLKEGKSSYSKD